jgi:hypothetical protein
LHAYFINNVLNYNYFAQNARMTEEYFFEIDVSIKRVAQAIIAVRRYI